MTASSLRIDAVVDTVVLRYFLFVEREDLLLELLGNPLSVPRTVFDPDERTGLPEDVMSEIRRSTTVQRRRSVDKTRSQESRSDASHNADRLAAISDLHLAGRWSLST